ncbi:MAG: hypothetical protein Q9227_007969 [Pyrenula ochraceoflavens]
MSLQMQMSNPPISTEVPEQSPQPRQARPPPNNLSTVVDGRIWSLVVEQQPIRARMCGFGDKDRRPITPPPCIRLVVMDQATGKELDIKLATVRLILIVRMLTLASEIDTSYYVLTVDIWDEHGETEQNIVKTSTSGSPAISAATTISYPPSVQPSPYQQSSNTPSFYSSPASVNPPSATSYNGSAYSSVSGGSTYAGYSPNTPYPPYNRPVNGYAPTGYPLASPTTPMGHPAQIVSVIRLAIHRLLILIL